MKSLPRRFWWLLTFPGVLLITFDTTQTQYFVEHAKEYAELSQPFIDEALQRRMEPEIPPPTISPGDFETVMTLRNQFDSGTAPLGSLARYRGIVDPIIDRCQIAEPSQAASSSSPRLEDIHQIHKLGFAKSGMEEVRFPNGFIWFMLVGYFLIIWGESLRRGEPLFRRKIGPRKQDPDWKPLNYPK